MAFESEAFTWFHQTHDTHICLPNKQLTLNDVTLQHERLPAIIIKRSLHLFAVYFKRYIYTCKGFKKKPNLLDYQKKILLQWQQEKLAVI